VDKMEVIFEDDWNLLENTNENKVTLITCIANKRNQRLCVQASEIIN
jgi:sortase (surface protein transpeptidase)